jgi:hypothetical protein
VPRAGCSDLLLISLTLTLSLQGREDTSFLSLDGRKGGQASSEDLFPLGYGEWERIKVRVKMRQNRLEQIEH